MTKYAARRLENVPAHFFAGVNDRIAAKAAAGVDVINLGVGSPDLPTPDWILDVLCEAARDPAAHRYPGYFGLPRLREAMAFYYRRRFGVELDPACEVLPLIGSKEGIVHSGMAWADAGDVILIPDPAYPSYEMAAVLAGAEAYPVPLRREEGYLPDLESIPAEVLGRSKVLWLNYPNNPTGVAAPRAFFQRAVAFAMRHKLLIAHDNPYCDVTFDGYTAPSILQVWGAREVAVEFNSLSKTYNMAGWRVAMAVGNRDALRALGQVKSNVDTGIPQAIQMASIAALEGDPWWMAARNAIYERRRDVLVEGLRSAGLQCTKPEGALYVWAHLPNPAGPAAAYAAGSSNEFANRMLDEAGVWITPGTVYGRQGEGYVRASLCVPEERIAEAVRRIRGWGLGRVG